MASTSKLQRLALAVIPAITLLLGACETTSYDKSLDTWIGVHSDNLIVSWGPPDQTYALSDGRQVLVYRDQSTILLPHYKRTCPSPTYETTGTVRPQGSGYSYEETTTQQTGTCFNSGVEYEPLTRPCETRFVLNHDGKVEGWAYEGTGC